MEIVSSAALLLALFIGFGLIIFYTSSPRRKVFKNNTYSYLSRASPMTKTEGEFFFKLDRLVSDRYYIFPQVHLSSIFDHRVEGQEWKYAFRHINGKSVDYLLCDKKSLMPTYAIELDDYTHDRSDRRERDTEVERIFLDAKLPLVRIRNINASDEEIIQTLIEARSQLSSK